MIYARPIVQTGAARPADALTLAGGWAWFSHAEVLQRSRRPEVVPAKSLPPDMLERLTAPRQPWAGLAMSSPRLMGILNVTPDSFSDGGLVMEPAAAIAAGIRMAAEVDILDIGGESTRPGAAEVTIEEEVRRIRPVLSGLRAAGVTGAISIDTRHFEVARAAIDLGATIVNDVSGLTHDPKLKGEVAVHDVAVVLMHSVGTPQTMQTDPRYDNVLLDVFDALAARIADAVRAGIDPARIVIDPGIGFGKTQAHNLVLLRGIALFHGLGHPILLGASRKRFIGTIAGVDDPRARGPGSIAVGLAALGQGVQILRVHDTTATAQARTLWQAVTGGDGNDA